MPVIDQRAEIEVEKILLATDFSPISETASAYANALGRRFNSQIEAVNVIDLSIALGWGGALPQNAVDDMRQDSEARLAGVVRKDLNARAETRVLEAFSPAEAILQETQRSSPDMIVMGTTSKHGMDRFMLGSTAETIIRNAPCPVLTVGPKVPMPTRDPLAFHNILYVTDFSSQAKKAAIYALTFAQDSCAQLYLCHVSSEPRTELCDELVSDQACEKSLRGIVPESAYDWCTPHFIVEHGHKPAAILELAEKIEADLIVIGARKASFWLEYVQTGLTPAILSETKCPVLTVC